MRNSLAEYRQKTLSCRLQKTRQGKKSEIQQNSFHPEGMFICQKVNQLCQHKRREQCENNRTADDCKKSGGQNTVFSDRLFDDLQYRFFIFHRYCLPSSDHGRVLRRTEPLRGAPHVCRLSYVPHPSRSPDPSDRTDRDDEKSE